VGGTGNDIYMVTDGGDQIVELASDNTPGQQAFRVGVGNDMAMASVSYALTPGAAVEDLMAAGWFTGEATDAAIDLSGNELGQGLWGNDAGNVLRGMAGDDILWGGAGADTVHGDEGNDFLYGGLGNDSLLGGDGQDAVVAFWGPVNGTSFTGRAGTLAMTGGQDSADGGSGIDTVVVHGLQSQFTLTRLAADDYLLTAIGKPSESLRFGGFERVSFGLLSYEGGQLMQTNRVLVNLPGSFPISPLPPIEVDTTAPTLLRTSPAANASNVPSQANLVLTFSEAVQAGSGEVLLKKNGVLERQFSVGDSAQLIFTGSTLTIDPATDLQAGASYTVEMGSGVVKDLAGNAYAGLAPLSFSTETASTAPTGAFISLGNARLVKDTALDKSHVSFGVQLSSAFLDGQKIAGLTLDLDYDTSLVADAWVQGALYGSQVPVWQFITPNLSGSLATGKIAAIANSRADNPLLVNGRTMDVTLTLNKAVDSFQLSFNGQRANLTTGDNAEHVVGTAAGLTLQAADSMTLQAQVRHWKGSDKPLAKVSLAAGDAVAVSDANGMATLSGLVDLRPTLTASKSASSAAEQQALAAAVSLPDAISILKMIVGLNVNANNAALSPYQVMAADFNRDGTVSLGDAIDVLKSVVGLSAPKPAWTFVQADRVPADLSMDQYNRDTAKSQVGGWMSASLSADLGSGMPVQLVGVLGGDLDGNWAG